ncbi:EI24 domain-containing protein [Puniceibacterium sediminis]|uniref:Uncharacterized protein involved in cysteine biosynthesis n=1 Tax=Puniceibacterium sediminis TaxID=1608407 RepID=A0A238Z8H3_9RHOB|nr:EI24 domain-containing protein [Puniceibacterium sediminis]SNR79422.1 Uncharacterized protein involved in cysteine biosynthesis [Puniceibacterium sediminis]
MILTAFFTAIGQIDDPRFRQVLLRGIALTVALLFGAYAGVVGLIHWLVGEDATLPFLGQVTWLNDLLSWGSVVLMLFLSVFLMVPVASAITSMFLENVAEAVEDRHYPHLPPVARVPFWDSALDTVNFLGVLIGANLLAVALYLIFAPAALLIFWALNGFLLGREYFTLVAMRRIGREGAKQMRRKHMMTIWAAGVLMAMPLSIPLMNLLVPILGAATFTHLFHQLWKQAPSD